jgi:hypothetical protein
MDNVREDIGMPHEDEFALNVLSLQSQYLSLVFPRRKEHYDRYLTFRGVEAAELERWKESFRFFLQKLTWKYRRPLLVKSPAHTGRIRLLLEMFPAARFVHIHRDPYVVFQSTQHLHRQAAAAFSLQKPDATDFDTSIIRRYQVMYDAYFEERCLVAPGQFHEVGFEELEKDPVGQIRLLYEKLRLPGFLNALPRLRQYVASLSGYRKNAHPPLSEQLSARIARDWVRSFEEWDYPADRTQGVPGRSSVAARSLAVDSRPDLALPSAWHNHAPALPKYETTDRL